MLQTSPSLPCAIKIFVRACLYLTLTTYSQEWAGVGAGQGLAPKLDRRGECSFRDLIVLECSLSEFCSTPQITLLSHPKFYYGHILMSILPYPAVLRSQSKYVF